MYALVIVTCAAASMVTGPDGGGYDDCSVAILKDYVYASQVECQSMMNLAAREVTVPPEARAFLFCITGEDR